MSKSIEWFFKKKLLIKDSTIKNLSLNYLKKAKNNIITADILNKIKDFKDVLNLPKDYEAEEWIIIASYYSMYMSALSILSKLGYKSTNHSATICALEEFFVKKNVLEKEYIDILDKIKIEKDEIERLEKVKGRRETAQYSVTKKLTRSIAEETIKDARKFLDKMEELFDSLPK